MNFPQGAVFSCHSCGKCCRSGFEIPVRADRAEEIQKTEFHQDLVRQGYRPLEVLAGSYHFLGSKPEGECCYHETDRCGLHARYGADSKPLICQLYPFNVVPTPAGYYVSTLFSCPSVAGGQGVPLEQHEDELQALLTRGAPTLPEVREHILVTEWITITWEQYLAMEPSLLEQLESSHPVESLLNTACLLAVPEPATVNLATQSPRTERTLNQEWATLVSLMIEHDPGEVWQDSFEVWSDPGAREIRRTVQRYLLNLVEGKLLLTGPSMVCRLLLVSASIGVLLSLWRAMESPDTNELFAMLEEQLVAQSNELEEELQGLESSLFGE